MQQHAGDEGLDAPFDLPAGDQQAQRSAWPDQLAALRARMKAGMAPFCDFGIFGPYGRRMTKVMKFAADVWVDGALQKKMFRGLQISRRGRTRGPCLGRP